MNAQDREARAAARRQTIVLRRTQLRAIEEDIVPLERDAAVSLVYRLTREGWAAARLPVPTYPRAQIPVMFIPGRLT